ncbi:hypothetical protein [Enterococcus sp. DIV1304_2]|uniref:hypothetical protein n=1 Tax=unclassified Enterococcus TaxID=2608891 RepID=UPI003D2FD4FD
MSNNSTWLGRASKNLLSLSEEKNSFIKAKSEWVYCGLEDTETVESTCQLCEQENLRYEYTIRNKFNFNEIIVGSSCIEKFIDEMKATKNTLLDIQGKVVSKERLKKDKKKYWEKILFKALDEKFYKNDFQQGITNKIKDAEAISINQAKYLRILYNELNENEKTAFKNLVIINLRKKKFKEQYYELQNSKDLIFINTILSSQQKKLLIKETS